MLYRSLPLLLVCLGQLIPAECVDPTLILGQLIGYSGGWHAGHDGRAGAELGLIDANRWLADNGVAVTLAFRGGKSDPAYFTDTACSSMSAGGGATKIISSGSDVIALAGPACSGAVASVAELGQFYSTPVICWACVSPRLSSPEAFPLFFRMAMSGLISSESNAAAALSLGLHHAVTMVDSASESWSLFSSLSDAFVDAFQAGGGKVVAVCTFKSSDHSSVVAALECVEGSTQAMVVVVLGYSLAYQRIFSACGASCSAGPGRKAWIGGEGGAAQYFRSLKMCSGVGGVVCGDALQAKAVGLIYSQDGYLPAADDEAFRKGRYQSAVDSYSGGVSTAYNYGIFMYDIILAYAHAVKVVVDEGTVPTHPFSGGAAFGAKMAGALRSGKVSFVGRSGPVQFNSISNDRNEQFFDIFNVQNAETGGVAKMGYARKKAGAPIDIILDPNVAAVFHGGEGPPTYRGCPAGTFEDASLKNCIPCTVDTFNSLSGQSACQRCPMNTYTAFKGASSVLDCICEKGTYHQNGSARTAAQSQEGCSPCPPLGLCPGDDALPHCSAGTWRDLAIGQAVEFMPCAPAKLCSNCSCAENHKGMLCQACVGANYYKLGGVCHRCPDSFAWFAYLIVGLVTLLGYYVPIIAASRARSASLSMTIKYIQLMMILFGTWTVALPREFQLIVTFVGTIVLRAVDLVPWSCLGVSLSLSGQVAMYVAFPLVYICGMMVICWLRTRRSSEQSAETPGRCASDLAEVTNNPSQTDLDAVTNKQTNPKKEAKRREDARAALLLLHVKGLIFALKLIHLSSSWSFIAIFDCRHFISTGQEHLTNDLTIVCGSDAHWNAMVWAVVGLTVWTIGIPIAFLVFVQSAEKNGYHAATDFIGTSFGKSLRSAISNWTERTGNTLDDLFDQVDLNKSGQISEEEFHGLLKNQLQLHVPEFKRDQLFRSWTTRDTAFRRESVQLEGELTKYEFIRIVSQTEDWTHVVLSALGEEYVHKWWEVVLLFQPVLLITATTALSLDAPNLKQPVFLFLLVVFVLLQIMHRPFTQADSNLAQTTCLVCVMGAAIVATQVTRLPDVSPAESTGLYLSMLCFIMIGLCAPTKMAISTAEHLKEQEFIDRVCALFSQSRLLSGGPEFMEFLARRIQLRTQHHQVHVGMLRDMVCLLNGKWDATLTMSGGNEVRTVLDGSAHKLVVGDACTFAKALGADAPVHAAAWSMSVAPAAGVITKSSSPFFFGTSVGAVKDGGHGECCCLLLTQSAIEDALQRFPFERSRIIHEMADLKWTMADLVSPKGFDQSWSLPQFAFGFALLNRRGGYAPTGFACTVFMFFVIQALPSNLKTGWYAGMQATVLFFAIVCSARLYWNNTHAKIIGFLATGRPFWQVVILSVLDWLRAQALPDHESPLAGRFIATTGLVLRLSFFCADGLKEIPRWFRFFFALMFFMTNVFLLYTAYFVNESLPVFRIEATNLTITTTSIQAGVASTMMTLTLNMIVTIWMDPAFLYCAMAHSYLPISAVEEAGVTKGSDEMQLLHEEQREQQEFWLGAGPKLSWVVALSSLAMFLASMLLLSQGNESVALISMRSVSLLLLFIFLFIFLRNNISWKRMRYVMASAPAMLVAIWASVFTMVAFIALDPNAPVSGVLGSIYVMTMLFLFVAMEAVKRVTRSMRCAVTLICMGLIAVGFYLSAYVWVNDTELADFNGPDIEGTVTKYNVWQICSINLSMLMLTSLISMRATWKREEMHFLVVFGFVQRQHVLDLPSVFDRGSIVGDNDCIVDN